MNEIEHKQQLELLKKGEPQCYSLYYCEFHKRIVLIYEPKETKR